ncbi:MAG: PilZ domain-containing protein [Desulfobulbaceae bacterium]|nr:PilZ domain-containing protein [Desulfobulbaceae bacterium]
MEKITQATSQDDRREFKRFRVKDGSSFVSHSSWPAKGTLIDISKGGFSFLYNAEHPWPENTGEGCLLLGDHASCLENVSTTVVTDQIVQCGQGNTMVVRRRSIKFNQLSQQQKFLLECFIWINSTAQC